MLEARQPVLVAGDQCSGKTTLCNTVLCAEKPHVRLPAGGLLRSRELNTVLSSINQQKTCTHTKDTMSRKQGLLLFVEDLHEAPCSRLKTVDNPHKENYNTLFLY